ncbi:hypothetical protein FSP39_013403 [Pinctada imbricata]|uniref:C2H2-type domain-containing protein n=1 Tax=Pinctada imbricata TaxID=66713 RepID=A0AA88XUK9_PINIB|nr:hypothetical protein FSP39_013403 [Pinctada imbricata]
MSEDSSSLITVCGQWKHRKRRFDNDADLFEEGNIMCCLATKLIPVEDKQELMESATQSYEVHYNSCHRNKCNECKRNFPSSHLLDIHIQEWHDAMFELMAAKQPMFHCLLESCNDRFSDSEARRSHMIKTHRYPSNFRFYQKKPSKTNKNDTMTTPKSSDSNKENIDNSMETDTCTSSGKPQSSGRVFSYKVPQHISFGHGVSRGFQRGRGGRGGRGRSRGKHWHQRDQSEKTTVNIESVDMSDLTNALE